MKFYNMIPHKYGMEDIVFRLKRSRHEIADRINKNKLLQRDYVKSFKTTFWKYLWEPTIPKYLGSRLVRHHGISSVPTLWYRTLISKYDINLWKYQMENWKCYSFCEHSISSKSMLLSTYSVTSIRVFTSQWNSSNHLPFLDILIIKNGANIEKDLHC